MTTQIQVPEWNPREKNKNSEKDSGEKEKDGHVWEKQDYESAKHYDLFTIYRDLGRNRTLKDLAEQVETSYSQIKKLSHRYNWKDRVEAWKKHESVMETKSKEKALQETYEILYENAPSLMETAIEMAEGGESTRMLKFLLEKILDGEAQKHIHELKKKDDEDVEDVLDRVL